MKLFFLLLFSLLITNSANADSVATIGDTTKAIDRFTSCDSKKWGNDQANACACCITKQTIITKDKPDKIVSTCQKDKSCTISLFNQLAPDSKTAEDITSYITWNTLDTPTIKVNPEFLTGSGKIKPDRFVDFLVSLKKDMRDIDSNLGRDFSNPKCLEAKDIGGGGANTAQLFLVKVNKKCSRYPSAYPDAMVPAYIVKETSRKTSEIANLRLIRQSAELMKHSLTSATRPKGSFAIAFDLLNFKYITKDRFLPTKSSHYLSVLTIAPGKSIMQLAKDLAAAIKSGDPKAEYRASEQLSKASYSVGRAFGELHKQFMDPSTSKKILQNTVVHGDAHPNNIYVDPAQAYLPVFIDFETFAKSLAKKRPASVDLFVFYSFPVAHPKAEYQYPKEISLVKWDNVVLKQVLLGYLSIWPPPQRPQLLNELEDILINPTFQAAKLSASERLVAINPLTYRSKIKDIKRVIQEIRSTL
ncbi:MAG: hypothetical protein FJX71_06910 [Alphaproteobacteria bacterium]|nr:hypothetical protein [Alphaproteobacteria bacterium]